MIEIRIIDESRAGDINIKNEPFCVFGRMIPSYINEKWSYTTETFPKENRFEMRFPDENYDYAAMKDEYTFIGAYDNDKCVGLAILKRGWFKFLYLEDLKVNAAYRSRGIGKALIEKSFQIAKDMGLLGLYTIGQDNNLAACEFYIKCGFFIGGFDNTVYTGTSQQGKSDIIFYKKE